MTPEKRNMLDTFLQYGDLNKANIVFIGYEEGVWSLPKPHDVEISIEARKILFKDPFYAHCRTYVNGQNNIEGWYLNEVNWNFDLFPGGALAHATNAAIKKLGLDLNWQPVSVIVINMQTRLHWLLQAGNRTHNYTAHDKHLYKEYDQGRGRHMIDFFPFPKRGKQVWDVMYNDMKIKSIRDYYNYYLAPNNTRWRIIKNLYDTLPMNLTVSYLGKEKGNFLQLNFFKNVGFQDFQVLNTGQINPDYTGPITESHTPKQFLIGKRINDNDQKQLCVLTPFLGMGQFGYDDVDALSTWL